MDKGPKAASSSSALRQTMEIELPTTDIGAVGTVDDSEMEDGHTENKRGKTVGEMEVCALDDKYDEWLDDFGQMLEDQGGQ